MPMKDMNSYREHKRTSLYFSNGKYESTQHLWRFTESWPKPAKGIACDPSWGRAVMNNNIGAKS